MAAAKQNKDIEPLSLKRPVETYQPRLTSFLKLMVKVRSLKPVDRHLWQIMDTPAFQDTETALHMALMNTQTGQQGR